MATERLMFLCSGLRRGPGIGRTAGTARSSAFSSERAKTNRPSVILTATGNRTSLCSGLRRGAWYQIYSLDGSIHGENFGFGTDVLAPADYDGDGKTDVAVFRPSDGYWYARNSSDGAFTYKIFGLATDIPAPGDFDGDGNADINVFRPSDGTWYRQNSSNGAFIATPFGTNGDKPTMTAFRY